uniref:Putative activating transcription factor of chaperone n=2 Tax=Amblyomma triste TaxID=251400 RepID=A0A023GBB8_AMBTT
MDDNWDLDSVVELCCSKLAHEGQLQAFEDAGNLDWLDEKVDLSAWTQLDFPDDLPPVMLEASDLQAAFQPDQSSNCGVASNKPSGCWESQTASPYSPDFLSPPVSPSHSPPTPTAVVPNVDIFINFDGHCGSSYAYHTIDGRDTLSTNSLSPPPTPSALGGPRASIAEERQYAVASAPASPSYFAANCSRAGSPVEISESIETVEADFEMSEEQPCKAKSEPTSPLYLEDSHAESVVVSVDPASPSGIHDSPSTVSGVDDDELIPLDQPQSPSCSSVLSPASVAETVTVDALMCASPGHEADDGCEDDPMDTDFMPEANGSDSESGLDSASGSKAPSHKKKRIVKRRSRTSADKGSRKERKRLQNKDAATRYRQKKKQEFGKIEEELAALSATNISLQSEAQRITNEISYLKGLMRELFRAKGLIK